MTKRLITSRQEKAFRLCRHEFEGLTLAEAAERMGTTCQSVSKLLAQVKKVMPQFFPILSKQEAKCYHYLTVEGLSPKDIARTLEISVKAVYLTLDRCKAKGLAFPGPRGNVLSYEEWMDSTVKHKF